MNNRCSRRVGLLAALLLLVFGGRLALAGDYRLAVYYFPGWKDDVSGFFAGKPWDLIKPYPERKPLLGWYAEGTADVMDQHLSWLSTYGIDDVVFDWYWLDNDKPFLDHAIDAYLQLPDRHGVGFAILWANHRNAPVSIYQWRRMVQYWSTRYFTRPEYMRENGKPVLFVFSPDQLEKSAKGFGSTSAALLAEAQSIARANGLPGLQIVANSAAAFGPEGPGGRGYDALTGYVYQRGFSGSVEPYPRDYAEMDQQYRRTWQWMLTHLQLPYYVPVVLGWDKRPWYPVQSHGENDACCQADPAAFRQHLLAARSAVDSYAEKSKKTVLICCWNEFGEGNYLEPTEQRGFQFLDQIRAVFPAN